MKFNEAQLEQESTGPFSDKEKFIRWIYISNSISSAISTRNKNYPFYKKDILDSDKENIKSFLRNYLFNLWPSTKKLDEKEMMRGIKELQVECEGKFGLHLHGNSFRLGISQKMIGLFAKFLWVSGQLTSPPPLIAYDGIIKTTLNKPSLKDWTVLDSMDDYQDILNAINNVSKGCPAEWELKMWNESVMASKA